MQHWNLLNSSPTFMYYFFKLNINIKYALSMKSVLKLPDENLQAFYTSLLHAACPIHLRSVHRFKMSTAELYIYRFFLLRVIVSWFSSSLRFSAVKVHNVTEMCRRRGVRAWQNSFRRPELRGCEPKLLLWFFFYVLCNDWILRYIKYNFSNSVVPLIFFEQVK